MDSIEVCISFKHDRRIRKVYVRIYGVCTLLGVLSQFDYIWSILHKDESFPTNEGYIVSIEDADAFRTKTEYFVNLD